MSIFTRFRFLPFLAVGCLLAAVVPLRAATIKYPKDAPVFSLEVPDGWKTEEDDSRSERVLSFIPKDGKARYQIYLLGLPDGNSADLAPATDKLVESTVGDNPRITGVKYGSAVEGKSATGIPLARATAACKVEGVFSYFAFIVFAPVENRRYEAVLCASVSGKDAGVATLDAIIHTIKTVD